MKKYLRRSIAPIILLALVATMIGLYASGWRHYVITGGSMRPTYEIGTVVFTHPVDVSTLEKRDIITYHDPRTNHVTTHTFIGFAEDDTLQTRGDANPTLDRHTPPLTEDRVIGKVWAATAVPVFSLEFWFQTPRGLGLLAISVAILFILYRSPKRSDAHEEGDSTATTNDKVAAS